MSAWSESVCRTVLACCVKCGDLLETNTDSNQLSLFVQTHDGVWIHPVPQQREPTE